MVDLAPTEYRKWPAKVPRPSFEEIRDTTLACMDLATDNAEHKLAISREMRYGLARQLIYRLCVHLHQMSSVETASKLGLSSHTSLIESRAHAHLTLAKSHAGYAIYNEVVFCLLRNRLNRVAAERRDTNAGTYADAAARSLRNHAGGAA